MIQGKTRTITLTLTQSCNLSCSYCYENHKSTKKMSFEIAKHILDNEFSRISIDDTLEIDLFGGEPFLEFSLIRCIVEYVKATFQNNKYIFFIITNGTLLNDRIKSWLIENKDCVICGLSFDGTKARSESQ